MQVDDKWTTFIERIKLIFNFSTVEELYIVKKGSDLWDSLRNIQIYVVLIEVLDKEIDANRFLEIKQIEDCKEFFSEN
jgi:acyl carrier protein